MYRNNTMRALLQKEEVWKTDLIVRYDPDVLARYRKDAVKHLLSSIVEAI